MIKKKNFNRSSSQGQHGSKRRKLAQHAHMDGTHIAYTHTLTSTQLQPLSAKRQLSYYRIWNRMEWNRWKCVSPYYNHRNDWLGVKKKHAKTYTYPSSETNKGIRIAPFQLCSVQFSSRWYQGAREIPYIRFVPSLGGCFLNVAFETVPMLVWLTMALSLSFLSRKIVERFHLSTPLSLLQAIDSGMSLSLCPHPPPPTPPRR